MRIDIVGTGVDNVDMQQAVERAQSLIEAGGAHYCVTPNSEILYDAIHSAPLAEIIRNADMVLPDGSGVVLASKLLGTPLKCKVAGVEFADALARKLAQSGRTLFLLGAKPGVAERAAEKLCQLAPGLRIAGTMDGYFKDDQEAVRRVREASPDVLYVCLGSPRQEQFIAANLESLGAKFMVGLGGFARRIRRRGKARTKDIHKTRAGMVLPAAQTAVSARTDDALAEVPVGGAEVPEPKKEGGADRCAVSSLFWTV